ncbi:hypothetical protein [Cerasicoccus maritimus]|uniref:hypothetical protein n=1 Tax=Cerasicoccus maritimus TaxID=490089 RepID=UPI002852CC25|nr:hypothetical protein [Cerasicoccus maritimus]
MLIITISPNNETSFSITSSGTASTVSGGNASTGNIGIDSSAFLVGFTGGSGLTFGGISVTDFSRQNSTRLSFDLASPVSSGSAYSLSGSATGTYLPSQNYLSTFVPGTYNITFSNGIFGSTASGTLTIASGATPIPEPTTLITAVGCLSLSGFLL